MRGQCAGHFRIETACVLHAQDVLGEASAHFSIRRRDRLIYRLSDHHLRVPCDLPRRVGDEIPPWQDVKVVLDLFGSDPEIAQLSSRSGASDLDTIVDQFDRRVVIVLAAFEEFGGSFEQLFEQLPPPLRPGVHRRGANVGEGQQVQIAQILSVATRLREVQN